MLEDLTIIITEQVNGAKLTYRLSLDKKGSSFTPKTANSIIGYLKMVFIKHGLKLNTDGITSSTSNVSGSETVS